MWPSEELWVEGVEGVEGDEWDEGAEAGSHRCGAKKCSRMRLKMQSLHPTPYTLHPKNQI